MAYQSWSVVFGEQPSASKWNILGTNDASFNDGTGIGDDTIDSRHYVTNSIDGEHLATNTVRLGSSTTLGGTSTSTSFATATNGSIAVTVPAGGRSVLILFYISVSENALLDWRVRKDATTTLAQGRAPLNATGGWTETVSAIVYDSAPSAGAHTYTFEFARATGAGTVTIGGGHMVVLLV